MPIKNLTKLKPLIRSGEIAVFGDIFSHVTIAEVAEGMGCGPDQVRAVRQDCSKMRLGELFRLSEAIGVGWKRVADLFVE
jgi:hypothetical protein